MLIPEIKNVAVSSNELHSNIRIWQPSSETDFAVTLILDIGPKRKRAADEFYLRLATPVGLAGLSESNGIISEGPLLVVRRYDFTVLWEWLQATVTKCNDESWLLCVQKLQRYFRWEWDDYT
ncbi:MAG: Imm8 family immunity protein [Myxococcota bacterium]